MQITLDSNESLSHVDNQILDLILKRGGGISVAAPKIAAVPDAAPDPEPEPAEPEGPTLQDAIDRSTALVGENKGALVREALKAASNAPKVSEMPVEDVPAFLAALDQAEAEADLV